MKLLTVTVALALAALGSTAHAQQLTLFEALESAPEAPAAPRQAQAAAAAAPQTGPAYTLRSISRFGDEYHSVLEDSSGKSVQVRWREGERVELPGMAGHMVSGVSTRELSLQHTGADRCIESQAAGVQCRGANTSVLSLATRTPLAPSQPPRQQAQQVQGRAAGPAGRRGQVWQQAANGMVMEGGEAVFIDPNGNRVVINPQDPRFSALGVDPELAGRLLERARQRMDGMQFQGDVNANDLPAPAAGAVRVLRGPGGDRFVPVRE